MANVSNDMLDAISKGDLDSVKEIVNSFGLNHFEEWDEGYVLLKLSIETKNKEITSYLLNKGAKVNTMKYMKDQTPLHNAVANGDKEIIEMLLNCSANVAAVNTEDDTPLHVAIQEHNLDIFKLLVHHKAPLDVSSDKENPLFYAITKGCTDILSFLLSTGIDINDVDKKGNSALFKAVCNGKLEIINTILSFNPDVEKEQNRKAFHFALDLDLKEKNKNIIETLLEYGFSFDANDIQDEDLMINAIAWDNVRVTEELLKCGADPTKLLFTAVDCTNSEGNIQLLLHHGANPNSMLSDSGGNALHGLIQVLCHNVYDFKDFLKTIETLLRYGTRPDLKDTLDGTTPLHIAAQCNEEETIELLLKYTLSTCHPINDDGEAPIQLLENEKLMSLFLDHDYLESLTLNINNWTLNTQILVQHIIKSRHLGYNIRALDETDTELLSQFENTCKKEVENLKEKHIGDSIVTYYVLLRKNSHQVAKLLKNESAASVLEHGDHRELFPVYARAIDFQYYRGKLIKQMMDKINEKCHHLFSGLSPDCIQMVLDYLNHDDLRVLITMMFPVLKGPIFSL